jgi:ribose/xylose/arabinose/galactoside ABC-type transport system permease subunit
MYLNGDAIAYSGYMVYLVATVAFTKMGFAIHGTVINRHRNNPIISTLKMISFIDAMVAIVVTQYTLLIKQSSAHAMNSSALFGMGCSALFVLIGIRMLTKKKNYPVS